MNKVVKMKFLALSMPLALVMVLAGCGAETAPSKSVSATNACSVDFINGSANPLVAVTDGRIAMRGWAFDHNTMTVPETVDLLLKDREGKVFVIAGGKRAERPDVAKVFKSPAVSGAGFTLVASVAEVPKGAYGFSLRMSDGSREVLCGIKKNITL
ncbi:MULTISPECIES: hypothetical protein [unclassified Pseudomonas]|uniref:hypothetical protein n=1 Tax=unclassified Pseudomonas TaxID=196821 RepID=UPI00381DC874